jgi:hypothetical protein
MGRGRHKLPREDTQSNVTEIADSSHARVVETYRRSELLEREVGLGEKPAADSLSEPERAERRAKRLRVSGAVAAALLVFGGPHLLEYQTTRLPEDTSHGLPPNPEAYRSFPVKPGETEFIETYDRIGENHGWSQDRIANTAARLLSLQNARVSEDGVDWFSVSTAGMPVEGGDQILLPKQLFHSQK